jgi:oligopeptide/dipeptide ABC transporter ATP-binding protein
MTKEPLLRVEDLRTWFDVKSGVLRRTTGHVRALDGVGFDLRPGEVLGVAGESGSGKSTLGRTILRLVRATDGRVFFRGEDVLRMSRKELMQFRRRAQMVFQDPYGSLDPLMTVGEIVTEPLVVQGLLKGRSQIERKAGELLELVALDGGYADRRPSELSGGQRQRVGIARALSVGPELLVADEPVSALDVSVQAQIINLLDDIRERMKLAMIFISHDVAVMEHLSDRIAVVYLGRIVEIGPARNLVAKPRHPYTDALISAVPEAGPNPRERIILSGDMPSPSDPPSGCTFRTRCRYAIGQCADERPVLRRVADDHFAACIRDDLVFENASTPLRSRDAVMAARPE